MLNAILCLLRQPDLIRAVGTCAHTGEMSHAYKQQGVPTSRCAQATFATTQLRTPLQGVLLARRDRGLTLHIELFILYDLRTYSENCFLADSSRPRTSRSHKGKDMSNGVKRTVLILDLAASTMFRTLHWQDHLPVVWRLKVKTEKQCVECFDDALRRPAHVLQFLVLALEVERPETCRPWLFNGDAPKLAYSPPVAASVWHCLHSHSPKPEGPLAK
ncbi:hypothetical protein EXIGLDRAFT_777798 [Exidia glandulosa HHB12029]|uniref:Uncharacterized protein n=1 Tax=Exidia glandulosa HHB12029 TaxID=1314781 RepID=A0A165CVN5_EXIGL|nr:hypothetical protein EXIGLDRAFT_777798 [Exidia glandulosa HHB12029]